MVYEDFKDLDRKATFDKVFNIANNSDFDG